ncbi:hypothetical protein B0J12DRAFT_90453 [Macrophomina phaseolina]|uniref:Uncharacterized protein n=1 Tax=Macrophomina phaseolina TaxID=35725 RepID=A0ABQ8GAV6_9PEZI|nr:hypothetical protein B0J12DRAFT_90453 [Macrophomina phaseolina]
MAASITRLWRTCLIAYTLLAAVATALHENAAAAVAAASPISDFAPPLTKPYPTPSIPTDINPLSTDLGPAIPTAETIVTDGGSTVITTPQAATFFNPSASRSLALTGTTLRAASTPTASSAEGEGGEEGRASGRRVSAVALVAAIAGLVGVVPL